MPRKHPHTSPDDPLDHLLRQAAGQTPDPLVRDWLERLLLSDEAASGACGERPAAREAGATEVGHSD
jgi:hypothetical protein